MPRIINAFEQFFDGEGDPLASGYLKFTVSGTNATDKDTYADVNETIKNANPVALDGEGRAPDIFGPGSYRVTLFNSDMGQIRKKDPVGGTSGTEGATAFDSWNSESAYDTKDIVLADDEYYYRSVINNNQGNVPASDSLFWERIDFTYYWNGTRDYVEGDIVFGSNSRQYKAVSDNDGNDPISSPAYWAEIAYSESVVLNSVSGELLPLRVNLLVDSGDFTLPLANSVIEGDWVLAEVSETDKSETPTISVAGADNLVSSDGVDADGEFLFDIDASFGVRFVSNGVDTWEI